MPNLLIHESSPYLMQHAYNPVDWHPWGEEALEKARSGDRPIFLSIGYAACHWCHVMERESFEDEETARLLNEKFVPVKVDREERPDLDAIYMSAVVALTGSGGWPMSVFLTPDGKPFFGGTYFPGDRRYGTPSFKEVLRAVADAWEKRREEMRSRGERLAIVIGEKYRAPAPSKGSRAEVLDLAVRDFRESFDVLHGGFGKAPKFPQPMSLEFLMRAHARTGDPAILAMVDRTLEAMARGGLFDHIGGGFHRYCVDEAWRIPHFEKMLYDNAQLASAYLRAWSVTGKERYRQVAGRTLDYLLREMTDPSGGFFSSQDADTEGYEGRFYVWSLVEVRAALGEDGILFSEAYGMIPGGNFEGRNVLYEARGAGELAKRHSLSPREVEERLERARGKLFEIRERRRRPEGNGMAIAGWNALALAAFAEGARVLSRSDYLEAAERNAGFLLRDLRAPGGRILRSWKGGRKGGTGFLEDYANLAFGLLALRRTTLDPRWLAAAREIGDAILDRFSDPDGGFFDTSDDHEELLIRPRETADNATPSGGAMAATVLLELAGETGESRYREAAERALDAVLGRAAESPRAYARWLCAMEDLEAKRLGG